MSILSTADTAGLIWGGIGFLTFSYALSRVIRGTKHGYSIRLQLFFTLFLSSMMSTTLIGWWAINRIEARAAILFEQNGLSTEMFEQFFIDFGAKTGLILGLLTLISAGGAWALGWGLASPIERLAAAAEGVTRGMDISSLPKPPGREVRRLREALVSMHEALEDRRLFEVFITDLSHDLKNPVAAIKASVEVLQAGAAEEKESRDHFLKRVDEASERLNLMLSDFLNLARLESRGLRFDPEPFSPLRSLESAMRVQEGLAQLKQINLICQYHQESFSSHNSEVDPFMDHSKIKCQGSHQWLTRAFENLISNAIKFSPVGSTVWIDHGLQIFGTNKEKLLSDATPTWWVLVSDEGGGVPKAISDQIFIRFVSRTRDPHPPQREDRSPIPSEGTGLGLAIVKQVIEAHNGHVELLSSSSSLCFHRQVSGAQLLVALPLEAHSPSLEAHSKAPNNSYDSPKSLTK